MTTTPLHQREAVLSEEHDRGMHRTPGTVTRIILPSPELARVTLRIDGLAQEPEWNRPNVALRLNLDARYGDVSRVYTVRACSFAHEEIEVDIVRHGESSPMMRWLDDLTVGDPVALVGPRPHFQLPEARGREVALFLDGTAIPALYALLAQAPADIPGRGWVATTDVVAFEELPAIEGLTLHRIDPGRGFADQLRFFDDPHDVVVWGAGERDEMRAVRSHFRGDLGLAKEDVAVFGYWKRGTSNTDIDAARLSAYEAALADGGSMVDLDDLALDI